MVSVIINSLFDKTVAIEREDKSLLWHFQQASIDWMHACGAKGRCTSCKMLVIEGQEFLSELSQAEQKFIDSARLKSNERLSCQALAKASTNDSVVIVSIPKKYQFSHINYSE